MDPLLAALLGGVVGLLALWLAQWIARHRLAAVVEAPADPVAPYRGIVASLASASAVVGTRDDVLAHNEAALVDGVVRGDRIGIAPLLDLVRQVRRTGEPADVELQVARPGRAARQFAARVLPLTDDLVFVVVDDRAPGERVQAAARDFMANATHELKTPIGAIGLLAEAVEDAADDEVAVRRFSGRIRAEAQRLGQLVSQIIQLSRLQAGDAARTLGVVAIDDLVGQTLDRSRQLADARGISLTRSGPGHLTVYGDAGQLVTALDNLVRNAIAFSEPKGRVVVTSRADADAGTVSVAVSDNGIGIAPEDAERIFERFYRVDYARSRENGGTGLGLSIVEEIVDGHGGQVTVWSRPGSGSTFTITLPAAPPAREEEAA